VSEPPLVVPACLGGVTAVLASVPPVAASRVASPAPWRILWIMAPAQIRYVVVGLGNIAQTAVLPGFEDNADCELVGLVSSDGDKRAQLSRRYHVSAAGGYDALEEVIARSRADAVFIATPNTLHRPFAERAARAGAHVLCEKPMAMTEEDCRAMIAAAEAHHKKLMIAYRLHFDAANLHAIDLIRAGRIGEARLFSSLLTHEVERDDIRAAAGVGGGALFDAGPYPINAARYLFADEPIEAFAYETRGHEDMPAVDATTVAILRFARDRLAQFIVSQRAAAVSCYRVVGERGDIRLEDAYQYTRPMKVVATVEGRQVAHVFPKRDQFGAELSYFARCIRDDVEPEPSGQEGLADVRVMVALRESARRARPVALPPFARSRRPGPEQRLDKRAVKEPEPFHAPSP
jgi:predicted dehydrogenase